MKLYSIAKGTQSIVITAKVIADGLGSNGKGRVVEYDDGRAYKTTKDLEFFDTVLDPVRLYNIEMVAAGTCTPVEVVSPKLVDLVRVGYALFRDDEHPDYLLAVEYNDVKVLG